MRAGASNSSSPQGQSLIHVVEYWAGLGGQVVDWLVA